MSPDISKSLWLKYLLLNQFSPNKIKKKGTISIVNYFFLFAFTQILQSVKKFSYMHWKKFPVHNHY